MPPLARTGRERWRGPRAPRRETPERESRFLELALEQDVLFKRGGYNYPAIAHDEQTLIDIEHAASSALVQLVEETQP